MSLTREHIARTFGVPMRLLDTRRGHFGVGVECGQRFWSRRSWRRPVLRRFPGGFAVGPVMIWRTR